MNKIVISHDVWYSNYHKPIVTNGIIRQVKDVGESFNLEQLEVAVTIALCPSVSNLIGREKRGSGVRKLYYFSNTC